VLGTHPVRAEALSRSVGLPTEISRLVLVQRDYDRRQRNARALMGGGFIVRQAEDGENACSEALAWPASVVVTDLVLPVMSGFEVCRRLRADARTSQAFIVGVTGWTGSADYTRAVKAGFDYVISSRCDTRSFLAEVQRIRPQGAALRRRAESLRQHASEAIHEAASAIARRELAAEWRPSPVMTREEALKRIRSDYFELPGLKLTVPQGARLWGLDLELCGALLEELAARGFLGRTGEHYGRR
jgi:DNA-binding response OmpR family regulator